MSDRRKTADHFGMFLLPFTIGLLFLAQPFNLTHIEGLNDDFSNMLIKVTTENSSYDASYAITGMEPGQWAAMEVEVPEGQYILNVLADVGSDGFNTDADPRIIEISYDPLFATDFSNMLIHLSSSYGDVPVAYTVIGMSEGEWVLIALERAPEPDETIDILAMAAEYAPPSSETQPEAEAPPENQTSVDPTAAEAPVPDGPGIVEEAESGLEGDAAENVTWPIAPVPERGIPQSETPEIDGPVPEIPEPDAQMPALPPQAAAHIPDKAAIHAAISENITLDLQIIGHDGNPAGTAYKMGESERHGGRSYGVVILPEQMSISYVVIDDLDEMSAYAGLISIDDVPEDIPAPDGIQWSEVYAIDPSTVSFSKGSLTAVASGNALFKCKDWDLGARVCNGTWKLVRKDLASGQEYSIPIGPEDPAFGEANVTLIDIVQSSSVGGNWTVLFETTGTADLTVRPMEGTRFAQSGSEADLEFTELRCGETVFYPVWDEAEASFIYEGYHCKENGSLTSAVLRGKSHTISLGFGNDTENASSLVMPAAQLSGSVSEKTSLMYMTPFSESELSDLPSIIKGPDPIRSKSVSSAGVEISVSLQDTNIMTPEGTKHYYVMKVENNRSIPFNIKKLTKESLDIDFNLRGVELYEALGVTAVTSEIEVPNAYEPDAEGNAPGDAKVERQESFQVSYDPKPASPVVPANSTQYYVLEVTTPNWEQGHFNITFDSDGALYKIDPGVSACSVVSSAGTYVLTADLTGAPNSGTPGLVGSVCMKIAVPHVILDCAGHTITNDGTTGTTYGVFINGSSAARINNVTVKNCGEINGYTNAIYSYYTNRTTFTNNTLRNGTYGVYMNNAANGTISWNTIYNISTAGRGILIAGGSDNVTVLSNTVLPRSGYGIYKSAVGTIGTIIENNTVNGAATYLLAIYGNNKTRIIGNHIYNSSGAAYYTYQPYDYSVSNLIIDRVAGDYTNYTNISIDDYMPEATFYLMYWSAQPSAPPAGLVSFAGKYVRFTASTVALAIDNVTFHWLDSELSGYDESAFELWRYNTSDGWVLVNNTPNTGQNNLRASDVEPRSTYAILYNTSSACPAPMTSSGTYTQTANIRGAPNPVTPLSGNGCVVINADDVLYDCAGYNISNNVAGTTYGIVVNRTRTNVTIQNCPLVFNYTYGFYASYTQDIHLFNMTVNGTGTATGNSHIGYLFYEVNYSTAELADAYGMDNAGFWLYRAYYNNFSSNVIGDHYVDNSYDGYGFYLEQLCQYNRFVNNTVYNMYFNDVGSAGIGLFGSSNYNLIANNTVNATPGFFADTYGFTEQYSAYNNYTGNTVHHIDGAAFYIYDSDYLRIESNTMRDMRAGTIYCTYCQHLQISANNITNMSVNGYGIYMQINSNATVTSNSISDIGGPAIYLNLVNYSLFQDNRIIQASQLSTGRQGALHFYNNAKHNRFIGNNISYSKYAAINMTSTSDAQLADNNTFISNNIYSGATGFYV
ncbi:MAG: right-handed parallel beta-helix repeat-containing protein, partial [Candidatus Micrarchaeota archaeon]